jgi:hypothetical protein
MHRLWPLRPFWPPSSFIKIFYFKVDCSAQQSRHIHFATIFSVM